MATFGKAPHTGSSKKTTTDAFDPLSKWSNDPKNVAQESINAAASFQLQINEISRRMSDPGLTTASKRALYSALQEAKKGLRDAKADTAKMMAFFKKAGNLKDEAAFKLKDVQELLKGNKDPYVAKYAKVTQDLLKELIKSTDKLGNSEIETAKVMKDLENVKASMENLPEEFSKKLTETTQLFDEIGKHQKEQRDKWSGDYKRAQSLLDEHSKSVKEGWKRLGLGFANMIGLGGVVRGIGKGVKAYKGVKNFVNHRRELGAARKLVGLTQAKLGGEDNVGAGMRENEKAENERSLVDLVKEYVNDNKQFNRHLLDQVRKPKNKPGLSLVGGTASGLTNAAVAGATGAATGAAAGAIGAAAAAGAKAAATTIGTVARAALGFLASGPGILGLSAVAALVMAKNAADERAKDPYNPKYEFDPVAMKARGAAKTLGQAGEMNRQRALKVLQPGAARDYLAAGPDAKGNYPEGYSLEQLQKMAKGTFKGDASLRALPQTGAKGGRGHVNPSPVFGTGSSNPSPGPGPDMPSVAPPVSTGAHVSRVATPKSPTGGSAIQLEGGANIKDLNPGVHANLMGLAGEYKQMTGKKLPVRSGFRSREEQAHLYRTKPKGMAAPPGRSVHNFGFGVDADRNALNTLSKTGILSKYGFERPIGKEPWHMQPIGMTLASAKSGMYSADAPYNQGGYGSGTGSARPAAQSITEAVSPLDVGSGGSSTGKGTKSPSKGPGSISSPSRNGVKDIATFDQSDGMFLAMNLGIFA